MKTTTQPTPKKKTIRRGLRKLTAENRLAQLVAHEDAIERGQHHSLFLTY